MKSLDPLASASNLLFARAWSHFAASAARGEVVSSPELVLAWANAGSPMLNMAFFLGSITTEAELRDRVRQTNAFAAERKQPFLLTICLESLDEPLRPELGRILGGEGLSPSLETTGMAADELLPPRRPAPELEYRGLSEPEVQRDVARINAEAYTAPVEAFLAPVDAGVLAHPDHHGLVGYLGGQAVTSSNTTPIEETLYVSWVATRPTLERRGLAEAVMRRSLALAAESTGLRRTALHASPAGHPLYLSMGYRPVASFVSFTQQPHG